MTVGGATALAAGVYTTRFVFCSFVAFKPNYPMYYFFLACFNLIRIHMGLMLKEQSLSVRSATSKPPHIKWQGT